MVLKHFERLKLLSWRSFYLEVLYYVYNFKKPVVKYSSLMPRHHFYSFQKIDALKLEMLGLKPEKVEKEM